jgi:hypothetical protein
LLESREIFSVVGADANRCGWPVGGVIGAERRMVGHATPYILIFEPATNIYADGAPQNSPDRVIVVGGSLEKSVSTVWRDDFPVSPMDHKIPIAVSCAGTYPNLRKNDIERRSFSSINNRNSNLDWLPYHQGFAEFDFLNAGPADVQL